MTEAPREEVTYAVSHMVFARPWFLWKVPAPQSNLSIGPDMITTSNMFKKLYPDTYVRDFIMIRTKMSLKT